jgi:PPK2 family polyphosphate:nucleotide phosphotransferase
MTKSARSKKAASNDRRRSAGWVERASELARRYRVADGRGFRLADRDPGDTAHLGREDKPRARELLAASVETLAGLQEVLYAQDRWALLLVFQGMDGAGKDSAIKHVLSGVNPQGCQVTAFKAPSAEELDHDYLWRCQRHLPERGRIGIFNRSHYEELVVVRVHPELLARQKLPPAKRDAGIWKRRGEDIRAFERHLTHEGTVVRKIFLHLSRDEQKKRFLERIDDPEKNWKFSAADVAERDHWDAYQHAWEEAIRATATAEAPWYVVPADAKWFTRLVVASVVIDALAGLELRHPQLDGEARAALAACRARLLAE